MGETPRWGRASFPIGGVGGSLRLLESLPIIPVIVKDSPANIAPAETAIGRPSATARRLVDASLSDNTRRAYAGALGQLDAWLDGRRLDDAAMAAYLALRSGRRQGVVLDVIYSDRAAGLSRIERHRQ